ncbi:MAG: pilus assembly protein, partial [Brevundimonas sp.]
MRRVDRQNEDGSVAVEFALVGPLMVLLIIGMVV